MAIAIDDEDSQRLLRLFNTPEGQKYMKDELGMSDEEVQKMTWLGISGIANVLCCIKMAKYYELTENDVVGTVLTDSAVMYQSRIEELNQMYGAYNAHEASLDHNLHMLGLKTDSMLELTYTERKRVHNLKYYTWVEQQQMNVEDLNAQWYDTRLCKKTPQQRLRAGLSPRPVFLISYKENHHEKRKIRQMCPLRQDLRRRSRSDQLRMRRYPGYRL